MIAVSRRQLAAAVGARLVGITNATGYFGRIGALNGLPGVDDTPADPPTKDDDTGRVRPYFILFPGVGRPGNEQTLDDTLVDVDWPLQVTAAAGDTDDLLALVDRIDARLHRWSPGALTTADGDIVLTGSLRVPEGYVPPVLTDRTVTPGRVYTPLQYQLTAHT